MYNKRLSITNVMNFSHLDLDLSGINGKIIAISGENGAGKTTLLECLGFASLYRDLPSRGKGIDKYCHGQAVLENEFEFNGNLYLSKLIINAKNNRVENYLYENGEPVNDKGKKAEFQEEIIKRFGTKQLALSSVFAAQDKSGGFLEIPRTERKELFISMLNLGILQDIANYSNDMATNLQEREKEILVKQDTLRESCAVKIPDKQELEKQRDSLTDEIKTLETEADEIKSVLSREAETIRTRKAAKARKVELLESIAKINNAIAKYYVQKTKVENEVLTNRTMHTALSKNIDDIRTLADALASTKTSAELSLKALTDVSVAQRESIHAMEKLNDQGRLIESTIAQKETDLSKAMRNAQRLTQIPCGGIGRFSSCNLIKGAVDSREEIPVLEADLESLQRDLSQTKETIEAFPQAPNGKAEQEAYDKCKLKVEECEKAVYSLREISDYANNVEAGVEKLQQIEQMIAHQDENLKEKMAELDAAQTVLDNAFDQEYMDRIQSELHVKNIKVGERKAALHKVIMEIGRVDALRKTVNSAKEQWKRLDDELMKLRTDVRQWKHLNYAFGPKAIQSIEIDSSGPTVSEIINDLLRSCFGTRFSVRMITQAEKADKSGMKDYFDIEVIDSERGRSGFIGDLSGGERVICSEAISLGIALYNAYNGGVKWDTLYRDECSGALSSTNAIRYIDMLRKAIDLGNFKRCIFIAHQRTLVDMADNRIILSKGRATIE